MFRSLALTVRELSATEDVLERVYQSARMGLRKDSLAYAAGLLPDELRGLIARDPLVERAIGLGRADSEFAAAKTLHDAAKTDPKYALAVLRYQHGWAATTHIQVEGQISILAALAQANERVVTGCEIIDEPDGRANARQALTNQPDVEVEDGYRENNPAQAERTTSLRPGDGRVHPLD
jgi:hypothetical protein